MDADSIGALFLVLGLLLAIASALIIDHRFRMQNPSRQPYRWGFYCGAQFVVLSLVFIYAGTFVENDFVSVLFIIPLSIVVGGIGVLTILRRRWAFITLTVLTLNPVIWIVNRAYIWKRLGEFKEEKDTRIEEMHTVPPSTNDKGPDGLPND